MQSPSVSFMSLNVKDCRVLSSGAISLRRSKRSTEAEPLNLYLAMYDKMIRLSFSFSVIGVMLEAPETAFDLSSAFDSSLDVGRSVSDELQSVSLLIEQSESDVHDSSIELLTFESESRCSESEQ